MRTAEHNTQSACVRWFRYTHPRLANLLFAVPNGARRTRWEAAMAKAEGLTPGVADLILMIPNTKYHGLCIEMKKEEQELSVGGKVKTTRGYQSPEQKDWQAAVEAQGYRYVVCHNIVEFVNVVEGYIGR